MRWTLLPGGPYTDLEGKTYKPGDVVEDPRPMDRIFVGRFRQSDVVEEDEETQVAKARELVAKYEAKLAKTRATDNKVTDQPAAPGTTNPQTALEPSQTVVRKDVETPSATEVVARQAALGDDVTESYPEAAEAGLTVHLNDESGDYFVAKDGTAVHDGGLEKKDVKTAIKDHVKSEKAKAEKAAKAPKAAKAKKKSSSK